MKRVDESNEQSYKALRKWVLDTLLFVLCVAALLAFFASTANAAGQSQVRNCQEDYGFEHGCKIDRADDGQFQCDGELINIDWHSDFELLNFTSTVGISLVAAKAGQGYEDHFFDPASFGENDLTAFEGRKHSHDLFCWDDPEPELGSCCFDCEEESGDNDTCEDEAAEAWCDEEGGRWELNTPCGERQDCNDECPMVPVGAICIEEGFQDDSDVSFCSGDMTLAECEFMFGEERCANDWDEGASCDAIACRAVPTMPNIGLAILLVLLLGGAMTVFHIKFMPTDRPVG